MAPRNRNEWLQTGESEDEDQGYNSEHVEESRGKAFGSRRAKRRKLEHSDTEEDTEEEENKQEDSFLTAQESNSTEVEEEEANIEELARSAIHQDTSKSVPGSHADADADIIKPPKLKSKLSKKLAKSVKKTSKTGIVYVSRIPPFMKPHTLKHFLSPFAPSGLGRIFLTPEDPTIHRQRVKSGGNKKRSFLDGWVEFVSKKEAKVAVETLNTKTIGGKKGGYYHDDVWNLKYLKGFKWRHLTEQIANENAERSARLRAEGARERREVREFLVNVEKAKMLDGMEKKRKRKNGDESGNIVSLDDDDASEKKERRHFRQTEVMSKAKNDTVHAQLPGEVQRVLNKIF
jgi:ESF2/ABP1 family protein